MSPLVYLNQWRRLYKKSANTSALALGISMYKVSVSYLNQQRQLYKKSANMSALALGNISIQCHHLLFKSVVSAIQKIGQYIGIGISISIGEYQCTRFPLVI